jgi:putative transposase
MSQNKGQQDKERDVQEFVISDALWEVQEKKAHPLGCYRSRVPDRKVLNGIFFVLRTGCQWKALDSTGICSGSTAHSRSQEWEEDVLLARLWEMSLHDYDALEGLDWEWLALDGAMNKAPLGGKKRSQPHRPRQKRRQGKSADGSGRHPDRYRD